MWRAQTTPLQFQVLPWLCMSTLELYETDYIFISNDISFVKASSSQLLLHVNRSNSFTKHGKGKYAGKIILASKQLHQAGHGNTCVSCSTREDMTERCVQGQPGPHSVTAGWSYKGTWAPFAT